MFERVCSGSVFVVLDLLWYSAIGDSKKVGTHGWKCFRCSQSVLAALASSTTETHRWANQM